MARQMATPIVLFAFLVMLPAGWVLAWHGTGGPLGTGTADLGSRPFSRPVINPPGYATCLIGNFPALDPAFVPGPPPSPPNPGHAMEHHWKVMSSGPTFGLGNDGRHTVSLLIGATTVNVAQGSSIVRATAIDAVGTKSVTVAHPLTFNGDTAFGLLPLEVDEGVLYDLSIETINTDPVLPGQRHYKIGAAQGYAHLGYGEPTLEYLESLGGPGIGPRPQIWSISAGAGELVTLTLSVDDDSLGYPGVPEQANRFDYTVLEPSPPAPPAVITSATNVPVGPATPITISFTNTSATRKSYVVRLVGHEGHFKFDKSSGADIGIYALNCPQQPPALVVEIDVKPGSDPSCFNNDGSGSIPVAILSSATFDAAQVDPATITLDGLTVKMTGKGNKYLTHVEDVNGDGRDDLVVQIQDEDGAFQPGDGTATLNGKLFTGQSIVGVGDICVTQ